VQVTHSPSKWRGSGGCGWVSALVCLFPRQVVWCCSVGWHGVMPVLVIPEAGDVVLFGLHGDMVPWGIHGIGGRARCHVVTAVLLCGCVGPVGVGHCNLRQGLAYKQDHC
jgi:hypothetical protein